MAILGFVLAALSAAATNVGFLMRHRGAVEAPDVDIRHLWRSAVELFKQKWWTIGYLVAFVAYGFHVAALGLAPLSLVQAVLAGGIVLLGVIAERFFGAELGKREWIGIILTAIGLTFLALTGEAKEGQESAQYTISAMIAFESALVGLGVLCLLAHRHDKAEGRRGPMLGVAAGLLFTVTHVAIKAITGKLDATWIDALTAASPYLAVVILGGIAAFFISARSLQLGPAVPVIAVTSIAGNASAIPAGIIVFGDPLGEDFVTVTTRSIAFIMVVVAAALIPAPVRAAKDDPRRAAAPAHLVEGGVGGHRGQQRGSRRPCAAAPPTRRRRRGTGPPGRRPGRSRRPARARRRAVPRPIPRSPRRPAACAAIRAGPSGSSVPTPPSGGGPASAGSANSPSATTEPVATGPPMRTSSSPSASSASTGTASATVVSEVRLSTTPIAPSSLCSITRTTVRRK